MSSSTSARRPVIIDRAGTVDRDDAISVRPTTDGWNLSVHVADVSGGVAIGSDADRAAFERRESAYGGFRGTAKMLPLAVEQQLTLAPARPCPALRVDLAFGSDGQLLDTTVTRDVLTGAVELDHQEAATAAGSADHPDHPTLRAAADLAQVLLERRRTGGALAFYDLNRGWATTEDGSLVRVEAPQRTVAYVIVQECMIAANGALARWAAHLDLPLLFRNHYASQTVADRPDFLHDIDLALASNSPAQLDALRERVHLVVRAAEYAPQVRGHWGLALPAYAHSTSPLRRYADLVSQRIVLAHLDGRPSPYSVDQLVEIAAHLNDGAAADRQGRAVALKSRAHRIARREVADRTDYAGLDTAAFHALLKRACKEGLGSDALAAEACTRIAAGKLSTLELQMLLLLANGLPWRAAQEAALVHVTAAPELAASILSVHAQTIGVALAEFDDQQTGASHAPSFTSRARMAVNGRTVHGRPHHAPTKKAARHLAAVSLLAMMAALPDPGPAAPAPATSTPAPASHLPRPAEGHPPVSALNELQQSGHIGALTFDFTAGGVPHAPVFLCTAAATRDGQHLAWEAEAANKSEAKRLAATLLLHDLLSASPL